MNSVIIIGDNVMINNNMSLNVDKATISIGDNTIIGVNFSLMTSDGHNIHKLNRHDSGFSGLSIDIGQNVFIGDNVMILKGVNIGNNAVIGAGSVVTSDIPKNAIAAGNPCKVIKYINPA
jgi:acetyltransferase-like isoleucine patch superfamily enzyme